MNLYRKLSNNAMHCLTHYKHAGAQYCILYIITSVTISLVQSQKLEPQQWTSCSRVTWLLFVSKINKSFASLHSVWYAMKWLVRAVIISHYACTWQIIFSHCMCIHVTVYFNLLTGMWHTFRCVYCILYLYSFKLFHSLVMKLFTLLPKEWINTIFIYTTFI